ncbi:hypothetical protein E4O04_02900 [Treponema sp. OMZ 799]|uniref:hypothetical protein n=1 Tax=Treponema sp. OMZ 799 TaxID=2563668 RepID=UPI0020A25C6F|nr:hypothetical protein [Treponema sp. OMZ 799]UTC77008.1 hypothetical protein E4O04_02900 [Treponema sp. OMZ 799]
MAKKASETKKTETTKKAKTPAKTAAKKTKAPAKKTISAYKQSAAEKKLAAELAELTKQMNAEGLLFLIEQARVHLYNMQVEALEEDLQAIEEKRTKTVSVKKTQPKKDFRIERSSDGSVYHIISGGKWKLINADELFSILKIVNAKLDDNEIRLNLIHWFFKERGDFVADLGLADTHDPRWLELIKLLKTNFKIKI